MCLLVYMPCNIEEEPPATIFYSEDMSRGSSQATLFGILFASWGYRLDDRSSRVRFPAGDGNFSLYHRVQNGFGAHPASYPMGTGGSFPGGEAAGA
jgi:hypothetical protein